jgi:hypothetical protein
MIKGGIVLGCTTDGFGKRLPGKRLQQVPRYFFAASEVEATQSLKL